MKYLAPLAFVSILSVSACEAPPRQAEGTETPAVASAPTVSTTVASPAVPARDYQCDSGETIVATYPSTESATVRYQGVVHEMRIVVSGSGVRYTDRDLEWLTKGSGPGSEGILARRAAGGASGDILERCSES